MTKKFKRLFMYCHECKSVEEIDKETGHCVKCGTFRTDLKAESKLAKNDLILGFGYNNSPWAPAFKKDLIDIHWEDQAVVEAKLAKGKPKNGKQSSKVPIRPQIYL